MSTAINKELASLFPQDRELQDYMAEYMILIVKFCGAIVTFTRRSVIAQMASSFVASEKEAKTLETDLGYWTGRMNDKIRLLSTKLQLESRSTVSKLFKTEDFRQHTNEEKKMQLMRRLSPDQDELGAVWRMLRRKGSVLWIFKEPAYVSWRDSPKQSVLWISGCLGSGKSILMANMASNLHMEEHLTTSPTEVTMPKTRAIASFFCQRQRKKTLLANTIVGSLVWQLVYATNTGLPGVAYPPELPDTDPHAVAMLAIQLLPPHLDYFIILDGLEECPRPEVEQVLSCLRILMRNMATLKVCCSSRAESQISRVASAYFTISNYVSTSNEGKDAEIATFVDGEIERRRATRILTEETLRGIRDALVSNAKGMWLWVSLLLDLIFPKYHETIMSDQDIIDMLGCLPLELDETFARALSRIVDRRYGRRIFEIVAAASRPLTTDELRVALNVDTGNPEWNRATLVTNGEVMVERTSGGLLEVDEETKTVHYIHHSVLQYLLEDRNDRNTRFLRPEDDLFLLKDMEDAEAKLGALCVTYLSYSVHDRRLVLSKPLEVDGMETTRRICDAVLPAGGPSRKLVGFIAAKSRPAPNFNIARTLQRQLRDDGPQDHLLDFLQYAKDNWLSHTKHLRRDDSSYTMFWNLVAGDVSHLDRPWNPLQYEEMALWALQNGHPTILGSSLAKSKREQVDKFALDSRREIDNEGMISDQELSILLVYAVSHDRHNGVLIKTLLRLGADPNSTREQGEWADLVPLQIVLSQMREEEKRDVKVLRILLDHGSRPNYVVSGSSPLSIACHAGWSACAQLLLAHGATVSKGVLSWPLEALSVLLSAGADPNAPLLCDQSTETTLLVEAIQQGDQPAVELLLRFNANPNGRSWRTTALGLALELQDSGIAVALLTRGACCHERHFRDFGGMVCPLLLAIRKQWLDVVKLLLAYGSGFTWHDNTTQHNTHLGVAIEIGNAGIVEALLEAGFSVQRLSEARSSLSLSSEVSVTPLESATRPGNEDVQDALLRGSLEQARLGERQTAIDPLLVPIDYHDAVTAINILNNWEATTTKLEHEWKSFVLTRALVKVLSWPDDSDVSGLVRKLLECGANPDGQFACMPPPLIVAIIRRWRERLVAQESRNSKEVADQLPVKEPPEKIDHSSGDSSENLILKRARALFGRQGWRPYVEPQLGGAETTGWPTQRQVTWPTRVSEDGSCDDNNTDNLGSERDAYKTLEGNDETIGMVVLMLLEYGADPAKPCGVVMQGLGFSVSPDDTAVSIVEGFQMVNTEVITERRVRKFPKLSLLDQ